MAKDTTQCRHGHLRAAHSYTTFKGVVVCRECRRLNMARVYQEQFKSSTQHRVMSQRQESV